MPQPADLIWTIPITGWLLSYHPHLVDAVRNAVPGIVLHHVAFWNENRSDFLCPNKEETFLAPAANSPIGRKFLVMVIARSRTTASASRP